MVILGNSCMDEVSNLRGSILKGLSLCYTRFSSIKERQTKSIGKWIHNHPIQRINLGCMISKVTGGKEQGAEWVHRSQAVTIGEVQPG
jgi:hypothetical protein